jgi:mono/diheme cytochrome c family protein
MRRFALFAVTVVVALVATACGPTPTTGSPPPPGDSGPKTPGQVVYDAQGCARCHALNGAGKGRDLTKVGGSHDKTWIAAHIRNAKQHNPQSTMPDYGDEKLNAKDLDTLAEYLAGLK